MATSTLTFISQTWFLVLIIVAFLNHTNKRRLLFLSTSYVLAVQIISLLAFTFIDIHELAPQNKAADYIYLAVPPLATAIGLYLINYRKPGVAMIIALLSLGMETLIALIIFIDRTLIPIEVSSTFSSTESLSIAQWQLRQTSVIASHVFVVIALIIPTKTVLNALSFEDISNLFDSVEYHVSRMPDGIVKKDALKHLEAAAILLFDFDENGVNKQYTRCALTLINHVIKQANLKDVQITDNQE